MAIHKLYKAIHQILLLRLNQTETACLKTLILFRPGEYGLYLFLLLLLNAVGGAYFHAVAPTRNCFQIWKIYIFFSTEIDL